MPNSPPTSRPEQDVIALTPHLCYEIKMLLLAASMLHHEQRLAMDRDDLEAWTFHNAMVETVTVHARLLTDFFFAGRTGTDDAIASDYVENWKMERGKKPKALRDVNLRVAREIVHLSYGRLVHKTDEDKLWRFWEIVDALVEVLNRWLPLAPAYAREQVLAQIHHVNTWAASRIGR